MRTSAGMSSDFVSPTSGWTSRPSTISSATFVRYSCARWIGLRVWNPTTRFQPRSAKIAASRPGRGELGELRPSARSNTVTGRRGRAASARTAARRRGARRRSCGRLLGLALLVVLEDLLDLERRRAGVPASSARATGSPRRSRVDGEADGKRPGQAAREAHLADDAVVVLAAHEALERRQGARRDHVEVGELARRELETLERVEVVGRSPVRSTSVPPCGAMRRSTVTTVTRVPRPATRPSSSSFARTSAADSSASRSVSTTSSALPAPRTGRRRR